LPELKTGINNNEAIASIDSSRNGYGEVYHDNEQAQPHYAGTNQYMPSITTGGLNTGGG